MLKVQEIRELIKLIDESSIDEFTYESNGTTVSMKKEKGEVVERPVIEKQTEPAAPAQPVEKTEALATTPEPEVKEEKQEAESKNFDYEIVSPMVGTFYEAASPDDDPYVQVGDKVKSDSIVCIVEAMKLFNEIEAETSGEVVEILVENGQLVEYGQPLFRVKSE
ncbi:acetyl-CoA carboxylase biotin carboxyl carrier protein [Pontibacillus yanchengensis]|uniref:Acetyl-CoA carboxylase biotin carboxyl carrier protein n=2 Tax=Pontibacillus yanchengensis TaxID=462910 RepID=A0ACC7VFW1_9BACI|nr:acetyl-CoA carboxylase biotin carboxyl carrier protein [Pontibacillus yanchengensis]MYL33520.1 acetyl-CoA carboxylase biotin carboxyl carrier protein [Pontibacillus yanchengensis]MYL53570.1 acetyl-CoA carboxylase biotin carboxyl carrier protein [Pontibacillus yanchengensis]